MQPTATDYLTAREGATWTAADTAWVMRHIQRVDALASEVVRRLLRERAVKYWHGGPAGLKTRIDGD